MVFTQSDATLPYIVGSVDGTNLPVSVMTDPLASAGAVTPAFGWQFANGHPITVQGGPTILSDEIRLLADSPTDLFDSLAEFSVLARDMPQNQFTIIGSAARPVPEPTTLGLLALGALALLRRKRT